MGEGISVIEKAGQRRLSLRITLFHYGIVIANNNIMWCELE